MKGNIFFLLLLLVFMACKKEEQVIEMVTETEVSTTFTLTFENIMSNHTFFQSGKTALILPGESQSYNFIAGIGTNLSIAKKMMESNDLFFGFDELGFPLYKEDGTPVTGDITQALRLWDAGIATNEGFDEEDRLIERENSTIQLADSLDDGIIYPAVDTMVRFSLTHNGEDGFVLTIENISDLGNMPSAIAPGIFAIHQGDKYVFKANTQASDELEVMIVDNNIDLLWNQVAESTGFTSIIGTGIYIVHEAGNPIFTNGEKDRGEGLEILAEYGNPEVLIDALKGDTAFAEVAVFNDPVGNNVLNLGGKLVQGDRYEFSFEANAGDYLSIANMLVETNDLFFAFDDNGLELFPNGEPINGDVTNQLQLWDAGTEANEFPGAGAFQPLRNGGKENMDEGGVVRPLNDEFTYPTTDALIRVTIKAE